MKEFLNVTIPPLYIMAQWLPPIITWTARPLNLQQLRGSFLRWLLNFYCDTQFVNMWDRHPHSIIHHGLGTQPLEKHGGHRDGSDEHPESHRPGEDVQAVVGQPGGLRHLRPDQPGADCAAHSDIPGNSAVLHHL